MNGKSSKSPGSPASAPAETRRKKKSFKILITAGATREFLDPVRFISSPSTGAMGFAFAGEGVRRGHKVTLVHGPTSLMPPRVSRRVEVVSARDMERAVKRFFPASDCLIMAAAISDWRPGSYSADKIKKKGSFELRLVRNPDIVRSAASRKRRGQVVVGFALETGGLKANAAGKMKEKNLDLIVGNSIGLRREDSPFGKKRTSVIIIGGGGTKKMGNVTKDNVARAVFDRIERLLDF